jgi:hypothetical protein
MWNVKLRPFAKNKPLVLSKGSKHKVYMFFRVLNRDNAVWVMCANKRDP